MKKLQQRPARTARKAVAADDGARAAMFDDDVAPVGERGTDHVVGVGIGAEEFVQRLVGENDAETKGVVSAVLLVNVDPGVRQSLFCEQGEV